MSKGQEQLAATVDICRALARDIEALPGLEREKVKAKATRTMLEGIEKTLRGVADTFFLRSNLCVYFTARCLKAARTAKEELASLEDACPEEACRTFQQVERKLTAFEKAAKTLADKAGTRQELTLT